MAKEFAVIGKVGQARKGPGITVNFQGQLPSASEICTVVQDVFPKLPLSTITRREWLSFAHGDTESEDAYDALEKYDWWCVPESVLFAGYAGIAWVPPLAFSYYLPGCVLKSMECGEWDGHGTTVACVGSSGYAFDGLSIHQRVVVGWYLVWLLGEWDDKSGWHMLAVDKLYKSLGPESVTDDIKHLLDALASLDSRWKR